MITGKELIVCAIFLIYFPQKNKYAIHTSVDVLNDEHVLSVLRFI